jgi:ketosteroid isomerase-like protein
VTTARELVEQAWTAIEAGDVDRLDDLFDEQAELSTSAGAGSGREYVKALFTRHREGYPDLTHEIVDAVESADGTAVALRIMFRGSHQGALRGPLGVVEPTGRALAWRSSDHVRVRGGRIVSWHAHFDRLTLLEQLGQLEHLRKPSPAPVAG